jgi:hypothetical protein
MRDILKTRFPMSDYDRCSFTYQYIDFLDLVEVCRVQNRPMPEHKQLHVWIHWAQGKCQAELVQFFGPMEAHLIVDNFNPAIKKIRVEDVRTAFWKINESAVERALRLVA